VREESSSIFRLTFLLVGNPRYAKIDDVLKGTKRIIMAVRSQTLQVRGLGKRKMSELAEQAKRLGMTPERYVKRLVEENLEISREAEAKTFSEIIGTGGDVDEGELDQLVEQARSRHHRQVGKKR
jgi:hypothetical protein